MNHSTFCIARVGEPIETSDGCDVHFVHTELADADAVITFLQSTYDRFATQIADQNAERSDDERIDLSAIGGFGVQLTNRFGGEIEIGLGRKFCLLIQLTPPPTQIYRTRTQHEGTLVFYVDGWHHTEMDISDLVPRDDCISSLRKWLETNVLPNTA